MLLYDRNSSSSSYLLSENTSRVYPFLTHNRLAKHETIATIIFTTDFVSASSYSRNEPIMIVMHEIWGRGYFYAFMLPKDGYTSPMRSSCQTFCFSVKILPLCFRSLVGSTILCLMSEAIESWYMKIKKNNKYTLSIWEEDLAINLSTKN